MKKYTNIFEDEFDFSSDLESIFDTWMNRLIQCDSEECDSEE